MRGRLVIGTALGSVVVTGACIWWNNQRPQRVEMAKAERTAEELAPPSGTSRDGAGLKSEKQIALQITAARDQLEDEFRGRTLSAPSAPAAPTERAIRPDSKASQAGDASVAKVTATQNGFRVDAPTIAATSTFSVESSLGRGIDKDGDFGSLLGGAPTQWAFGAAAVPLAKLDFD